MRVLNYDYPDVCKLVNTVAVLHNMCVLANIPFDADGLVNDIFNGQGPEGPFDDDDDDDVDDPDAGPERMRARDILRNGQRLRHELVQELQERRQQL